MNITWNRTAVTGALLAAMAAPLIVMPRVAHADLASAVESGSYGPVVTIVTPQYADVVKGSSVSIAIAVESRTNPAQSVEMFVDDHIATPGWVPLKSLQSSNFNWNTTLFSDGPHKLTVRVADTQGLIGQAEITVYVNNGQQQQSPTAPGLQWLGVQNGQVLSGTVNLQLAATGSFGVKYIFVMINPVSDPDQKPALRSWMINQPPYIIPFDTTKVNDGLYVLDALAYDSLSDEADAPRLHVGISNSSINPTWFNQLTPYQTNSASVPGTSQPDSPQSSNTVANTVPSTTNSTVNTVANVAPQPNNTSNSNNNTTTNTNSGQTNTLTTQLQLPPAPLTPPTFTTPGQQYQGATDSSSDSSDNSGNDNDNDNSNASLMVGVSAVAEVQAPSPEVQPRVSTPPMLLATSNDAQNGSNVGAQSVSNSSLPTSNTATFTAPTATTSSASQTLPAASTPAQAPQATIAQSNLFPPSSTTPQTGNTLSAQGVDNGSSSASNNTDFVAPQVAVASSAQALLAASTPAQPPLATIAQSNSFLPSSSAPQAGSDNDNSSLSNDNGFVAPQTTVVSSAQTMPATAPPTQSPLATIAQSNSVSPSSAAPQSGNALPPVLEAALPSMPTLKATSLGEALRQGSPISTLIETTEPDSILTAQSLTGPLPQHLVQTQELLTQPHGHVEKTRVSTNVPLPVFPQASLNAQPVHVAVAPAPVKSIFNAPSLGMAKTDFSSRMAPAAHVSHNSSRLLADAQLGMLPEQPAPEKKAAVPYFVAPTPAPVKTTPKFTLKTTPAFVTSQPAIGQPYTTPLGGSLVNSRIASADLGTHERKYQHVTHHEAGESTKPKIAFLPKFNSKSSEKTFAAITVSPMPSKMQVNETSHPWPAVYVAKQREQLSEIARRYGLPVEVLAVNNHLDAASLVAAGQKIKMPRNLLVTYNGKPLHTDVGSMMVGTTSVAAFRFLFEQQGGTVTWDAATRTVHAKNDKAEVTLTIGSKQAVVNEKEVMMDMATFLLSGRAMVPVRFFEESLHAQVTWDPATGRMFVAMANGS